MNFTSVLGNGVEFPFAPEGITGQLMSCKFKGLIMRAGLGKRQGI